MFLQYYNPEKPPLSAGVCFLKILSGRRKHSGFFHLVANVFSTQKKYIFPIFAASFNVNLKILNKIPKDGNPKQVQPYGG
jgi:hypothetical protein